MEVGTVNILHSQTSILASSQRSGEKPAKQIRIKTPLLILRKPFN